MLDVFRGENSWGVRQMPITLGVKIIHAGPIRAISRASCPASDSWDEHAYRSEIRKEVLFSCAWSILEAHKAQR